MSPMYKEGVYWLVLLAITIAVYAILTIFLGPLRATGAFGLLGLAGFQPLLYRKRRQAVVCDERDTQVAQRALMVGHACFWLTFTLGIMGLWAVLSYTGHTKVSIDLLPFLVFCGVIVFTTARALAVIVQYRLQEVTEDK